MLRYAERVNLNMQSVLVYSVFLLLRVFAMNVKAFTFRLNAQGCTAVHGLVSARLWAKARQLSATWARKLWKYGEA